MMLYSVTVHLNGFKLGTMSFTDWIQLNNFVSAMIDLDEDHEFVFHFAEVQN